MVQFGGDGTAKNTCVRRQKKKIKLKQREEKLSEVLEQELTTNMISSILMKEERCTLLSNEEISIKYEDPLELKCNPNNMNVELDVKNTKEIKLNMKVEQDVNNTKEIKLKKGYTEHSCSYCKKKYSFKDSLRKHLDSHKRNTLRSFSCNHCEMVFTNRDFF